MSLPGKTQRKLLFLVIETTKKINLGSILGKLNQRHNWPEQASLDDCDIERFFSSQFLQTQKNQLPELQ